MESIAIIVIDKFIWIVCFDEPWNVQSFVMSRILSFRLHITVKEALQLNISKL